ncbi:MAG: hypothetical protein PHR76_11895 [Flavobacterium sp.]|nr:hypothetical protein [Flavobacterium sp.]
MMTSVAIAVRVPLKPLWVTFASLSVLAKSIMVSSCVTLVRLSAISV